MRVPMISLAALAITISSAIAANGHRGSLEDQLACTPDVYKYCSDKIPDEDAIVACLKLNRAGLSNGCARVFASPNPGAEPAAPSTDDDD